MSRIVSRFASALSLLLPANSSDAGWIEFDRRDWSRCALRPGCLCAKRCGLVQFRPQKSKSGDLQGAIADWSKAIEMYLIAMPITIVVLQGRNQEI